MNLKLLNSIPTSFAQWNERIPLSKEIANVLAEGYHSTLKSLNLMENYFLVESDIEHILKSCTQLEELRLSAGNGKNVLKFIENHMNKLKYLCMPGAYLRDTERNNFRMAFPDAIIEF